MLFSTSTHCSWVVVYLANLHQLAILVGQDHVEWFTKQRENAWFLESSPCHC